MIDTPATQLDRTAMLSLYREMLVIRRCEEQLAKGHQAGLIHGACHTYVGEEAVAVGVCAHLRQADAVFSTHRGHGHALAKGVTPRALIAELFGRATGPCILQAAGAGYSFKLLGLDQVGVAFFGDGASNNGAFHEGLNLAAIWDLPAVFVCENNMYATEVPFAYASRNTDIADRAVGYGIPGVIVDGNDVLAVYEVAGAAVRRARSGGGPTLIECKTYRTRPHSEGMRDGSYRSVEEIESWKSRDPIRQLYATLTSQDLADEQALAAIDAEVQAQVAEAYEFAKNSPYPDGATALDHVFS